MELKIGLRQANADVTVMELVGEIHIYNSAKVRDTFIDLMDRGRYKLLINLEKLRSIDSSGLGVFMGAMKRAREHDGALNFIGLNPHVNSIFHITGLDRIFATFGDEASALEGFG